MFWVKLCVLAQSIATHSCFRDASLRRFCVSRLRPRIYSVNVRRIVSFRLMDPQSSWGWRCFKLRVTMFQTEGDDIPSGRWRCLTYVISGLPRVLMTLSSWGNSLLQTVLEKLHHYYCVIPLSHCVIPLSHCVTPLTRCVILAKAGIQFVTFLRPKKYCHE